MRFFPGRLAWSRIRLLLARKPRLPIALGAALAVVAVFGAGVLAGRQWATPKSPAPHDFDLAGRNDALQNQLAILRRDRQVSQVADRVLQKNLAERDEEIRSLRADQAFYSKLVGADAQPGGLAVHGIALDPIAHTRAFNFTVTLTHSAEGGKEIQGKLSMAVEGIRGDKLAVLNWSDLGAPGGSDGLPFAFKYFQQVQGTLMLPAGFTPNRIRVTLDPEGSQAVTHSLPWSQAMQNGAGAMP